MSEFLIKPRKKPKRNKPTIKVGQVIKTIHGDITILQYGNNTNVQIKFSNEFVRPNPQWVAVQWIRKNQIKDQS